MDVSAHGEVDEDKDVKLDEDGEAQENGVEEEAGQAQPPVQCPLVQMNTQNLHRKGEGLETKGLRPQIHQPDSSQHPTANSSLGS